MSAAGGGGLGATAATAAGSMASRGAATKLQLGRAKQVADLVASQGNPTRTPLIRLPGSLGGTPSLTNPIAFGSIAGRPAQ